VEDLSMKTKLAAIGLVLALPLTVWLTPAQAADSDAAAVDAGEAVDASAGDTGTSADAADTGTSADAADTGTSADANGGGDTGTSGDAADTGAGDAADAGESLGSGAGGAAVTPTASSSSSSGCSMAPDGDTALAGFGMIAGVVGLGLSRSRRRRSS
jgi:MYXO-CTERM domain-containing protein